jgi:outer membrane protein OmpA-like peptidoglycan-associated protein
MIDTTLNGRPARRRSTPWLAALSALALAACSVTPDWANPVEWYKGATSVFDDEPAPAPANEAAAEMAKKPIPGEGEPFPNLASVPERPRSVTPSGERKKITEALVSDRANARYVDEPPPRATGSRAPARAPSADITASPSPPVSSAPAAPPPPAPSQEPPRSAPPPVASAAPPPPAPARVAPRPAPAPQTAPEPQAAPSAPRGTGSLVMTPSGDVKSARPGDSKPLSNTAVAPPVGHIPGTYPMAVVLFNDGSTQISAEQRAGLGEVVREANARGAAIRIVGHASPPRNGGSANSLVNNFHVATDRAQAVASALIRLGVPAARVRVEADTSPDSVPDVANVPQGDAGLRRADIFLE